LLTTIGVLTSSLTTTFDLGVAGAFFLADDLPPRKKNALPWRRYYQTFFSIVREAPVK
jgi:hypothetical protein